MDVDEGILKILKAAMKLEAQAYLYYYNSAQKADLPEVRSLFMQLAEEERKHQRILFREYKFLKKTYLKDEKESMGKEQVSYSLPDDHRKLLWKAIPRIEGVDIAGLILPSQLFGGDFFDLYPLKGSHQSRSAFAVMFYDVMGHGMDTSIIKSLFRASVEGPGVNLPFDESTGPSRLMTHLNRSYFEIPGTLNQIISASFAQYDPVDSILRYSVAGIEPPALVRSGTGYHEFLFATDYSIGIEKKREYHERSLHVNSGDIIFFYSDGLTEAESPDGDFYGRERAVEVIKNNKDKSSQELLLAILKDLRDFISGNRLSDEMSLLLIKF